MKTTLLSSILLFTGLAHADIVEWGDLTTQANALINRPDRPALAEVNELAVTIKAATPNPVSSAISPTDEQAAYLRLVDTTSRMLFRRISAQTGIDYAVARQYWWQAGILAWRAGKYPEAVDYATRWKEAEPREVPRLAFWLKARASNGQDVKTQAEDIAASDVPLNKMIARDLLEAWCLSAGQPYPAGELQSLIDSLAESQSLPTSQPIVRLMGATKKVEDGINVNQELTTILKSITGLVRVNIARDALAAFNHAEATDVEVIEFYDQLLRITDATPAAIGFLRNVLDQKAKIQ